MDRRLLSLALLAAAVPAHAHITPNVQLTKRGAFVQSQLGEATQLFEKDLDLSKEEMSSIRALTHWTPSNDDVKVYLGRDDQGQLVGTAVFLWLPSQHGPLGLGVIFDPSGAVRAVTVTDVASEPLAWVRPLLAEGGVDGLAGLGAAEAPDPAKIAPAVEAKMPRYYAGVIADGVARAQAIERALLGR